MASTASSNGDAVRALSKPATGETAESHTTQPNDAGGGVDALHRRIVLHGAEMAPPSGIAQELIHPGRDGSRHFIETLFALRRLDAGAGMKIFCGAVHICPNRASEKAMLEHKPRKFGRIR